jgi:cytochrome c556
MVLSGYEVRGSAPQQPAAKMTAEDYDAIMKKVGPVFASMRKNLEGEGDAINAGKEAQQLAELFGDAEKFWKQHDKQDAVKWAQNARASATEIASAIASVEGYRRLDNRVQRGIGLRLKRARTAAANMGSTCKSCHDTYREGDQANGFRLKAGTLSQ